MKFSEAKPNFKASTEVEESDVYVIAVPTPLDKEMKMANLKAVKSASQMIAEKVKDGDLVILESTVPPGTSKNFIIPILKKNGGKLVIFNANKYIDGIFKIVELAKVIPIVTSYEAAVSELNL